MCGAGRAASASRDLQAGRTCRQAGTQAAHPPPRLRPRACPARSALAGRPGGPATAPGSGAWRRWTPAGGRGEERRVLPPWLGSTGGGGRLHHGAPPAHEQTRLQRRGARHAQPAERHALWRRLPDGGVRGRVEAQGLVEGGRHVREGGVQLGDGGGQAGAPVAVDLRQQPGLLVCAQVEERRRRRRREGRGRRGREGMRVGGSRGSRERLKPGEPLLTAHRAHLGCWPAGTG